MIREVLEKLLHRNEGIYLDATFGRGGHSRGMLAGLAPSARVIAIDRDEAAVAAGRILSAEDARFTIVHGQFSRMQELLADLGESEVDGVLMDVGVSSPQLDDPERGFSFRAEGPLDMRMDQTQGESAAEWLDRADAEEIVRVLREFGEERFAGRIAARIISGRPITTTVELADLVAEAIPARYRRRETKHPATRTFQAIRIHINRELEELEVGLAAAWSLLKPGGRLAVIAFHSLEDRLVKRRLRSWSEPPRLPRRVPVRAEMHAAEGRLIGKATKAGDKEVEENPRARSAVLRVIEKTGTGTDG